MRNTFALLAVSSCLALTGCMSSLRIKPATDLKKPQGLLFYTKVGACKQQTIWLEYRYELSGEKFGPVVINQQTYDAMLRDPDVMASAGALTGFLKGRTGPVASFVSDETPSAVEQAKGSGNLTLAANTGEFTTVVDYTNPMWLNSGRPLNGTTQVDGKFGPDGTLTEASAQVDNETLSTILTAVASVAGTPFAKTLVGPDPKAFQLTVKVSARAHTHTRLTLIKNAGELAPVVASCGPSTPPITDGSWVITDALQPPADAKKADDKPAADKKP